MEFNQYLDSLSTAEPNTPGGGSAACIALALANATLLKVIRYSQRKLPPEDYKSLLEKHTKLTLKCIWLSHDDTKLFWAYTDAFKLPIGPDRDKAFTESMAALEVHTNAALEVTAEIKATAVDMQTRGNFGLANDAMLAEELAEAARLTIVGNGRWCKGR